MKDDLTNQMIAEALGYNHSSDPFGDYWESPDPKHHWCAKVPPDFLHNLNVALEPWKALHHPNVWGLHYDAARRVWSFQSMGLGLFFEDTNPARAICRAYMAERNG